MSNPIHDPAREREPQPPIAELISLRGRSALVTGAARGIGAAIARRLVEAGANAYLADRDEPAAQREASSLGGGQAEVVTGALDVRDSSSIERAVGDAVARFGRVDILVSNAGVFPPAALDDLDPSLWHEVIDTNVSGAVQLARAVAPSMRAAGRGVIVNITSTGAIRPQTPAMTAYVASKHALDGVTKSLALELGPAGIRWWRWRRPR